jgi:hypothetical protein
LVTVKRDLSQPSESVGGLEDTDGLGRNPIKPSSPSTVRDNPTISKKFSSFFTDSVVVLAFVGGIVGGFGGFLRLRLRFDFFPIEVHRSVMKQPEYTEGPKARENS